MELKERIEAILALADLSASAFAKKIGVRTPQTIYDLTSGKTRTLSPDVLSKITSCYPSLSVEWLMTGEGEMLRPSISQKVDGSENYFSATGNVSGGVSMEVHQKMLDEISAMRKTFEDALARKDEQISRLLCMLERLNSSAL